MFVVNHEAAAKIYLLTLLTEYWNGFIYHHFSTPHLPFHLPNKTIICFWNPYFFSFFLQSLRYIHIPVIFFFLDFLGILIYLTVFYWMGHLLFLCRKFGMSDIDRHLAANVVYLSVVAAWIAGSCLCVSTFSVLGCYYKEKKVFFYLVILVLNNIS